MLGLTGEEQERFENGRWKHPNTSFESYALERRETSGLFWRAFLEKSNSRYSFFEAGGFVSEDGFVSEGAVDEVESVFFSSFFFAGLGSGAAPVFL